MTDPTWRVIEADCIEAMQAMDESSVDAVVTDPPYGLEFMGKEWDSLRGSKVGNPDLLRDDRMMAEAPATEKGNPWASERPSYGAPKRNPRCRRCGKLRFNRPEHGCHCETPDWDTRTAEYARVMQDWHHGWATQALRVLKPGGHLLAFGGTRTYHRLACALEDAGFEIRDCIAWMYGSGFPKSLDVSKAIDKAAGAEREVVRPRERAATGRMAQGEGGYAFGESFADTAPATDDARTWQGWGTALKPAFEPIVVARKPLGERNVAANVLRWGTGALNVDGCRIEMSDEDKADYPTHTTRIGGSNNNWQNATGPDGKPVYDVPVSTPAGRWPANVTLGHSPDCEPTGETRKVRTSTATSGQPKDDQIFGWQREDDGARGYADEDGTETVQVWRCAPGCAVAMLDEQTGELHGAGSAKPPGGWQSEGGWGFIGQGEYGGARVGDTGGASRFFYCPKADREERNRGLEHMAEGTGQEYGSIRSERGNGYPKGTPVRNSHPTVKPVELMRWLVRLVTPKGGTVLDPFTGSGTTGIAAMREGFTFIGVEREPEYAEIARARIVGDSPMFNTIAEVTE